MPIALHNYLKTQKPQEFVAKIKDKEQLKEVLTHLEINPNYTVEDFVEYMLVESKSLLNNEKRKEALIILKIIKSALILAPKELHAFFYLTLADSFLLANDYEGARKSVNKAHTIATKLENPQLKTRVYNMLFIIHRTIEKDKAMEYLLKSKEISEEHNFKENIVFCNVNIGLIHFFNEDYNKAADYCSEVIEIAGKKSYPANKLIMPMDFFLQIFSEKPGLVVVSKYQEMILSGIKMVLRAIKQFKNDYEATRRISILGSFLRLSDELIEEALSQFDNFIEKLRLDKRASYYAAVASGVANYKDYQIATIYFEKALKNIKHVKDDEKRKIKKNYSFTMSLILGISMLFDLNSSPQTTQRLKKISITCNEDTLIAKANKSLTYQNAVSDSDAVFAFSREIVQDKLIKSIKDQYKHKKNIIKFTYTGGREDILENLEVFIINCINQDDEVESLLFAGTTIDEKSAKKKKRIFSGYQILGHIIPPSLKSEKYLEDYDIRFLDKIFRAPQKFKEIEVITVDESIDVNYKGVFEN